MREGRWVGGRQGRLGLRVGWIGAVGGDRRDGGRAGGAVLGGAAVARPGRAVVARGTVVRSAGAVAEPRATARLGPKDRANAACQVRTGDEALLPGRVPD